MAFVPPPEKELHVHAMYRLVEELRKADASTSKSSTRAAATRWPYCCSSNRDAWVYNFSSSQLLGNVERIIANYNRQLGASCASSAVSSAPCAVTHVATSSGRSPCGLPRGCGGDPGGRDGDTASGNFRMWVPSAGLTTRPTNAPGYRQFSAISNCLQ